MAPDERRKAIVEATLPLLAQYGAGVTTRQIAEAAGIAEGTIFRVFPDKPALLMAAAEETMNPSDGGAELEAALAGHDDLRDQDPDTLPGAPELAHVGAEVVTLHDPGQRTALPQRRYVTGGTHEPHPGRLSSSRRRRCSSTS